MAPATGGEEMIHRISGNGENRSQKQDDTQAHKNKFYFESKNACLKMSLKVLCLAVPSNPQTLFCASSILVIWGKYQLSVKPICNLSTSLYGDHS